MSRLLMLTTGGTIASAPTDTGLAPKSADELLARMGDIVGDCDITVREILTLDSTNIQPEEWRTIAQAIDLGFREHFDGIIVTHGTDTMAYTASMMSFMLKNPPVPVVFTGSQVSIFSPLTDADFNLRCAFAMAQSGARGVFVAFDRKIMLGCRAVKVRTSGFNAFESVNREPVGSVDSHGLRINSGALPVFGDDYSLCDEIEPNVFLLKLTPATNPAVVDMLIDSGVRGIVIEAFGTGGLQFIRRDFPDTIERANQKGIPVVVCSQCLYEASDFSLYQVGQMSLKSGAIQGHDMTSEAAVTKLMWALGQGMTIEKVRQVFAQNITGEVELTK